MNKNEYFIKGKQAPYLQQSETKESLPGVGRSKPKKQPAQQEADAAAGVATSFTKRVSSFSLLPRVQSTGNISRQHQLRQNDNVDEAIDKGNGNNKSDQPKQSSSDTDKIEPDWRLRDRMKTIGVGLILALNIGTDPPDITKPHPCAVLECWIDPRSVSRSKAKEIIGERLEMQYAKWQLVRTTRPLKHRRALDPTIEDVRSLCVQLRRQARNERILLHYNGHGVPRPTANGEIWVFDKNHTEYIPLSVLDLRTWMGKPSIVVLDCSAAGILIPFFKAPLEPLEPQHTMIDESTSDSKTSSNDIDSLSSQWVNDTIVLCGCSENEWLPMGPDYPADIFTSCLTTPIPMALRWFVRNHPTSMSGLDPDAVDGIPGKANDRKTPLGELNWIFTAVTDSIAWNMLPKPIFQRLFRQDLLVASMFRNFLLADRIMRSLGCTPTSHPPLPPGMAEHPLWLAWDLVCETLLFQLMKDGVLGNHVVTQPVRSPGEDDLLAEEGTASASGTVLRSAIPTVQPESELSYSASSPFFSEQLTGFEVWLEFASIHKRHLASGSVESPEQLPVVLQVLLSQVHRVRALLLLRRFLDLGPWAVNLALSLGIFPYVMKLLQSPEYKSLLVSIWAAILAFDPSCRVDLLKDGAFHHFAQHLMHGLNNSGVGVADTAQERTTAAFILSICCLDYPAGQAECMRLNIHGTCCTLLASYDQKNKAGDATSELQVPGHFRLWLVMCLANMIKENALAQNEAFRGGVHSCLINRLHDRDSDVRAAACYAIGCLIRAAPKASRASSYPDLTYGQQAQPNPTFASQSGMFSPNLVMPGHVHGQTGPGMQLQPSFQAQSEGPSLQWRPQTMEPLQAQVQQRPQMGLPAQQFFGQSAQFRTPQGHPISLPYSMQGQPMQPTSGLAGPSGFLVGGNHGIGISQSTFATPQVQHSYADLKPAQPSVYDDSERLRVDLNVMEFILNATKDASILARYEAVITLGYAVTKYQAAFVAVAEERSMNNSPVSPHKQAERQGSFPIPRGLDSASVERFRKLWETVRSLRQDDPCPAISQASNKIVSCVHEHLLQFRMQAERQREQEADSAAMSLEPSELADIAEEPTTIRTPPPPSRFRDTERAKTTGAKARKPGGLRRVLSEGVEDLNASMESQLLGTGSAHNVRSDFDVPSYSMPQSAIYSWKKDSFDMNFESLENEGDRYIDPLSPIGAAKAHYEIRVAATRASAEKIADHFACLAPKPPMPSRQSIQMLLEQEEEALEAAEEEAASKRKKLELTENKVFRNEGVAMTTMLRFHPFENILVSCGGTGSVVVWDTDSGSKLTSLENGNPDGSRMTTCGWMNEESTSMLYIGCDDGTVRFWGDVHAVNGSDPTTPSLISAFHALPMKAGQRGSGLVCEWQQWSGCLLAGGNSSSVNCWDLGSETLLGKLETNNEANVTTLTTAWDADETGHNASQSGFGPDTLVAGFSDGTLRIFDLRAHRSVQELITAPQNTRRRPAFFKEHKSWVVSTSFTGYNNRYELISGTVDGEIKAWDLRMSSSIRTMEVQRSTMTALSVHPKLPVVATGSHAQFIKLLTLEGDTIQVLRYHEKMASHRIGPVSCLAFHKYKPLLAAGSTDTFIGLYTPKKPIVC